MNSIFRYFIESDKEEPKRLVYATWFVDHFPSTEFQTDDLIMYFFMSYCTTLNVPLKEKYMDVFMQTELRKLLVKHHIHVIGTESLVYDEPSALETALQITKNVMNSDIQALHTIECDIQDFAVDMKAYMYQKVKERTTLVMSTTFEQMQSSDDTATSVDYLLSETEAIRNLYDPVHVDELVEQTDTSSQMTKVAEFGLPAIDKDSDGIWTTQLVGIEAQPGTGKTRFALSILYNAATIRKTDCLFITLEQKKSEVEAMLLSKHVYNMFGIVMPDKLIKRNKVPNEYKPQVEAARIDLFSSGKYGKLVIEETDFFVETFIKHIKRLDRQKGPFSLICIDYMGLLESKGEVYHKEKTLYDIIKSGFRQYKRYVRSANKAGIAISQFNKEGIAAGQADKQITTSMAEGGLAVYRNTDFNIAMSMTDTMKSQRKRRFSQPKVRDSEGFGNILINTQLGILYFEQVEQIEV